MGWGTIAYIEKCFVLLMIDGIAPGTKGLYWVLKKKKFRRKNKINLQWKHLKMKQHPALT